MTTGPGPRRGRPPRRLLGRTAAEWAQALDTTERSVQRWISGQVTPPLAQLQALAATAGVSLDVVVEALQSQRADDDADR